MNTSDLENNKNIRTNYVVLGVALALVSLLYLYFSFFLLKNPAEVQKSAAEKRREELIQSVVSPPPKSFSAEEQAQITKSVSDPKVKTFKTSEQEKLIKSLTEL
ncbi:hypothetical protein A2662_00500 [Candidatus Giovannonibacteria bacterium RIFCSPHIGHO2_01_FULL_45_33]|uniref:Uncharacterized protein n=1 Tax=Candidatus Giovannonibacteria bacterium RIFCSPLOWO2_01_FULL_45_34 TaxID=1798351 RepID=A0A1F5WZL8_9BACT|nr:MAG: hypothetical protein A2662_00500 [Candidatus Giovannonibacteria bacterium RIFCSPHIGHO2_01_FULL_45_33]OGF69790.1 MAG: hypothetical protein A3C73_03365 [Candidatus Giovannonibacteria bacterium RIFCSPHIGHO2_02_FULL_44_11]OGF80761.1 MAG: hypothetical protein A2930_02435 [Candidatus Giovannonibacteria bacterium RIFCSPLOWO2_01_FULL_45_34]